MRGQTKVVPMSRTNIVIAPQAVKW